MIGLLTVTLHLVLDFHAQQEAAPLPRVADALHSRSISFIAQPAGIEIQIIIVCINPIVAAAVPEHSIGKMVCGRT